MKSLILSAFMFFSVAISAQQLTMPTAKNEIFFWSKNANKWLREKTTYTELNVTFTAKLITIDNTNEARYTVVETLSSDDETSESYGVIKMKGKDKEGVFCTLYFLHEEKLPVKFIVQYSDTKIVYSRYGQ